MNGQIIDRRQTQDLELSGNGAIEAAVATQGASLMKMQTSYATAMAVQKPRVLNRVTKDLLMEAGLAGETFFYGWGAGKDKIEGPSVDCAMAAVRAWGNCAIEMTPVQETHDAWLFTASFVDIEAGFTITRQFRQSKKWQVFGKMDDERKADVRFQIGQSKAIRNVVLSALPKWLIGKAVEAAKEGVRAAIEDFIAKKGIVEAINWIMRALGKHGVTEDRVLARFELAKREGLDIDQLVILRGDLAALEDGKEHASELFPVIQAEKQTDNGQKSVADKVRQSIENKPQQTQPAPTQAKQPESKPQQEVKPSQPAGTVPGDTDAVAVAEVKQEEKAPEKQELKKEPERATASVDDFGTPQALEAFFMAAARFNEISDEQAKAMFGKMKVNHPITKLSTREMIANHIANGSWDYVAGKPV